LARPTALGWRCHPPIVQGHFQTARRRQRAKGRRSLPPHRRASLYCTLHASADPRPESSCSRDLSAPRLRRKAARPSRAGPRRGVDLTTSVPSSASEHPARSRRPRCAYAISGRERIFSELLVPRGPQGAGKQAHRPTRPASTAPPAARSPRAHAPSHGPFGSALPGRDPAREALARLRRAATRARTCSGLHLHVEHFAEHVRLSAAPEQTPTGVERRP
jgi:hypothetical protein